MKKVFIMLMSVILLSACSNGADWSIDIVDNDSIHPNELSEVAFKITEGEQPAANLSVNAKFEMAKMDHGTIDVELIEQGEGIYTGKVNLPMGGDWQAFLTISDKERSAEELVLFTVEDRGDHSSSTNKVDGVVGTINGETITEDDLEFYKLINDIQIEMYREADQAKYQGKDLEEAMNYWDHQEKALNERNTLLSQIIRLRGVALLAEEKGHTATVEEIQVKLDETEKAYKGSSTALEMINHFGEDKFWDIQERQQKLIVLSSKVQQDVLENVKKANPEAENQEVNMLASKKYEELLVSQIGTLDIEIF